MVLWILFLACSIAIKEITASGDKTEILCKTRRCRPGSLERRVCRIPHSKGITSILMMREYSHNLCEKDVTFGADNRGRLWTDGGCDGRFQVCYTTRKAVCFDDSECGTNAECSEGNCRCMKGYFGNPYHLCEDLCTCSAYGDPHYRQFEKKYFTFNGFCKYTMTKFHDPYGNCSFNIEVKNEQRGSRRRVSYTRLIDVYMYGMKIQLHKKKKVYINGLLQYMPVKLVHQNVTIYNTGEYGRLVTGCGVSVLWNGKSEAIVMVPRKYGANLTGLCGNCNGKDDDLVTRDGTDVSGKRNYEVLIGESFEVKDDTGFQTEKCETKAMDDPCTGILDQYVEKMEYCGMLHIKNQAHSPFRDCIEDHQDLAETLYASCRYDVCAYYHDVQRRNKIVCESLNSLAAECESRGVIVKWRRENFCPMACPSNMRYSTGVSGCPATCLDPNPDPAKCLFPPTEGCQCLPDFVSSGDNCVPVDDCGCESKMGYIPVGESMMTLDCSSLLICNYNNGTGSLITTPINLHCHQYASCGLKGGKPSCACKQGYFGDGVNSCYPLCNGKKCSDFAHCEDNRCVCDHGYHGNAYIECEVAGICYGKKCHRNAVCVNYNCVCKPGFIGDGYHSCQKLCNGHSCVKYAFCDGHNECKCRNGFHGDGYSKCDKIQTCGGRLCAKQAHCINDQCMCKSGYYGQGATECTELCGGKRCVGNAVCIHGSCLCKEGYHGNGYFNCEINGQCNGHSCAANAYCQNGKCQCRPGYYGDPYIVCRPLCNGKKCTKNAICDQGKCTCKYGYHGNPLVKCETVDVCNGKHCALKAICMNYQCTCKPGYFGDGYVKCDSLCNGRKCEENAYCYKDTCQCNDGFHGNGYIKCETKDLCGGKQCAPNAKCINYHCVCKDGYVGSGYIECEELCNNRKCAKYAVCVHGQCQCRDGFHGNPLTRCTPIEYCDGRQCALNAKCNNFQCVCDYGYYGNGYYVCTPLCNNVRCVEYSECQNGQCMCKEGYHGDGTKKCEVLSLCGGKKCTTNAACIDYQCQCLHGYLGNGYNQCQKLCNGKICKENAFCSDVGGCLCKPGYHGCGTKLCESLSVCGGKSCVANAHCFDYKCVCDTGYVGSGYSKCEKLCKNRKCAAYAFCDANECICQNGYHGNPFLKCEQEGLCDGKVCTANAVCDNYKCHCRHGYRGDGYKSCTKLCNGKICVANAVCSPNEHCVCGPGYHGDGFKKCEVLSLCGGRVCHQYAVCEDYQCKCKFGYYGDGITCTAYCGGHKCKEHSSCIGEECKCEIGYHGDGKVKCEDVGTCGGKVCCKNAECLNYHCVCKKGFYGIGNDMCLPYCNNRKCVHNANCVDGKCLCKQGYHGDGYYKCELLGICNGERCAEHSECVNYKCGCKYGYYGDGYSKCEALCGGKPCMPFSVCRNETCQCIGGYHGNGFILCEPLTQCGGHTCHFNAECMDFKCHCRYGYTGDGYKNCVALCGNHRCVEHSTCVRNRCECVTGYHGDGTYKCEADGICGGKICAPNARCDNFTCVCMNGYTGDGFHRCDELCNGKKCHDKAFCYRGQCTCNTGYHGDGINRCEDDRFCDGKTCAANADCIDFKCQCKERFHGNGYTYCEPLCSGKICAKYGLCIDGCCTCQPGYHGNAYVLCELKKFCGNKTCAEHTECLKYQCQCSKGYTGNGYRKCDALCNGKKCVRNAKCVHNMCVCDEGYHGDGYYRCEADGFCDGHICSKNAQCDNFLCKCQKGYYGDGYTRCDPFCGGKLCVENAHCVAGRCSCHTGFHGNPFFKCEPLDYCGGKRCHMNAMCEDYKCKCRKGYHGDGYYFCDPEGFCKGVKCAQNSECVDGRCVCRGGFVGDGHRKCERKCICSAFSNAYIKTYDGQFIYHNGACRYTLTKSTRFPDPCAFHIDVIMKSDDHGASKIKAVVVEIFHRRIQLGPGYNIYENGYLHYLPLSLHSQQIHIRYTGNWLLLTTTCGLHVWWNGDSSVMVHASNTCSSHLTGLCGNCNGKYVDDFITRHGSDVSGYPAVKRDLEIIKSYIVTMNGQPINMQCIGTLKKNAKCTLTQESYVADARVCGYMKVQNEHTPFRKCNHLYPNLARMMYEACRRDVCMNFGDDALVQKRACVYVQQMAMECLQRGILVKNFRYHCGMKCPLNSVYSSEVTACPADCMDRTPTTCDVGLPFSEGCTCKAGYYRSGHECVPANKCGCYCPDRHYIPLAKSYTTEDCSETVKCQMVHERPEFRHTQIGVQCHRNATCSLKDGIPACMCLGGLVGDGYKVCQQKILTSIRSSSNHLIGHDVNHKFFSKVFYGQCDIMRFYVIAKLGASSFFLIHALTHPSDFSLLKVDSVGEGYSYS